MKRLNPIAASVNALILSLAALVISPLWAQPATSAHVSPPRTSGPGHAPHPGFERGDSPAEVHIYAQPESERWPSNYWPDNYRLDGYDGQPDRATVCHGDSGRTYSTRTIECPEGQAPSEGSHSWSTSP